MTTYDASASDGSSPTVDRRIREMERPSGFADQLAQETRHRERTPAWSEMALQGMTTLGRPR